MYFNSRSLNLIESKMKLDENDLILTFIYKLVIMFINSTAEQECFIIYYKFPLILHVFYASP